MSLSQSADSIEVYDFVRAQIMVPSPTTTNPATEFFVSGSFEPASRPGRSTLDELCDSPDGTVFLTHFVHTDSGEFVGNVTYSAGSNIGNTGMSEERADERGAARHLGELRGDAIGQPFALLQGPACMTGALRMAPDQLIGVEVRGIAGQIMQGQCAVEPCDVFLDDKRLVGWQSIEDQMQGLAASAHHPAQQIHEQRAGQGARIGGEPEGACGTDGRRSADALALAGNVDHRSVRAGAPRLTVDRIGAKARLIPKRDLGLGPLGVARNRGIRLPLPGLLRRQALSRQHRPNRGQAQPHAESLGDQFAHNLTRPQAEVEPVLPRIFPIDPVKHLPLLSRGQGPWAAGRGACRECVESVATPACRREPAIDRAAVKAVARDHVARALALAHALNGHLADGLQGAVIQCPSVSRHRGTEHDTIRMCCLYY